MTSSVPDPDPSSRLDSSTPHSARIWNYWLGGKDNFAVDRAVGDQVKQVYPDIVDVAVASRAFLGRVVRFLAGTAGIRQFLDIGTGLPTVDNTHDVAQRIAPESKIVYVDNDPLVLVHARALLTSSAEGVTEYIDADVHDPDTIVKTAAQTLDFTRPVAVMMLGILGNVADDDEPGPAEIVGHFLNAVPSGSYLVINDSVITPETAEAVQTARNSGADYQLRTPEQIQGFFTGLDLVDPGVVPTPLWRPEPGSAPTKLNVYCGVARKP
ncbi:SAM-dependent methyltransferase [Jidongwangia harbinensis]|uniref:SAM-dependent methyltransferase n=1 Tax=Jidongwangia harbinensis TaxID=2878561 RepID=UPI001CD9CC19|nr:SAM-dependent methyltransferase [Jidongwangia harbinensis]MCA2218916.1 SAM-dependent methyltransferase [Jidongwangia harbinensis]